jgi:LPPG:FO 2-phospho-L-lactate transferase
MVRHSTTRSFDAIRCVALSGGIGGAKLALGLYRTLERDRLAVIANVGDDFDHLGLRVCPDIDTVSYTLAGIVNPSTGWGRADETASFMTALAELGGETWFHLGDRDLAIHVERTRRLALGESLSSVAHEFAARLGIRAAIIPASDDPVRTMIVARDGRTLEFQHYFVRERCVPEITGIRFDGAEHARPAPGIREVLSAGGLEAIVVCPSNPYISIDPILAIPGLVDLLRSAGVPVIAVSPIVAGRSIKGPTAKMMTELGVSVSAIEVARRYGGVIDGIVIDRRDTDCMEEIESLGIQVISADTVMESLGDRDMLARTTLAFAREIAAR